MAELLRSKPPPGKTSLLVLQSTSFCNISCEYCYLPDRNRRHVMSLATVQDAIAFIFNENLAAPDLTVLWHSGEPLVLKPDWYRKAFDAVSQACPQGVALPHAIQTNATLINGEWCDLFEEYGIRVGVSLDGPASIHDARRKTRSGRGTHDQVMRGVSLLQKRHIPFHVIAVVSAASLDAADDIIDFFASHGITEVGFNIEEIEGASKTSTLTACSAERVYDFFERAIERALTFDPPVIVREKRDFLHFLASPIFGRMSSNAQNSPFCIVTVSANGELFTFSPELAGLTDVEGTSYSLGSLPGASLEGILKSDRFQSMSREIRLGVDLCRSSCAYFDVCLGGAPVNKLAENGTFASAQTMYCRFAHMAVADAVLNNLEKSLTQRAVRASDGVDN
ncbi:cyclophane-forming radical SAM/SPASM peptide maturase GrrM/OscB [Bosea vestrisii]|uniref:cyclophane-forming radical SAM/SPASM peptide maturase GrrM/OscB n=1 Tax=Bosea vestrisii TaxID=151416 RepID=UPI0024DF8114|nr:cyclophane-forming radical SAM/SPASM peptide maturase GrrM/OscB [Bosea vestrisii]WID99528.1 cyclophane-forming radical SAM/SPASM peptide maturase GrrM/OscB [Bosea vestrisii]